MDADGWGGAGHPNNLEVSIGDEIRYYSDDSRQQGGFVMCLDTSGGSGPVDTRLPTYDPTFDPTINPNMDPTFDPTINPTINPNMDPTFDPTMDPTHDYSDSESDGGGNSDAGDAGVCSDNDALARQLTNVGIGQIISGCSDATSFCRHTRWGTRVR